MRILIHSNGPHVPSGYGGQTALLLPRLRDLGHDVAVSAFYGLSGSNLQWEGFDLFPAGQADYGVDVIAAHANAYGADLVMPLMDFWKLFPAAGMLAEFTVAPWLPIDCSPLGTPDNATIERTGARPIAMSRFGQRQLIEAGLIEPLYVPHAVDTAVFRPDPDRAQLRESLGLTDRFVIGVCAANNDSLRKGFPEQFAAFAAFRREHPEALLMLHSQVRSRQGFDLIELANDMGIGDAVRLSDQYAQISGRMGPEVMCEWFNALDVLSACSYAEAFGVPIIEAQACGTPVIVTDGSAMAELCGAGWKVPGAPFWNPVHRAYWTRPDVDAITAAYEKAHRTARMARVRDRARTFALEYDADRIAAEYWKPTLELLGEA